MAGLSIEERLRYEEILKDERFADANTITYSSLRIESANLATQNTIPFAVNQTDQTIAVSPSELRLKPNDGFYATRIGIFPVKLSGVVGQTTRPTGVLRTYINPVIFNNAAATATGANPDDATNPEASAMQSIYAGYLKISIAKKVVIPQLDMMLFQNVPTTQEYAALTVTAGVATKSITVNPKDGWTDSDYGFMDLTPQVIFSGQDDNEVVLNLSAAAAMAGTNSTVNFIVIIFRGFLLQNMNRKMTNAPQS